MSICGTCKTEGTRIKTSWSVTGVQRDECPHCAPGSFDKFTIPSDKKIWMGYEAHPNEYRKVYDSEGVIYERKPEYRSEQERRLTEATEEEQEAQSRAIHHKRATRRTTPMTRAEQESALHKAEEIASYLVAAAFGGTDIN